MDRVSDESHHHNPIYGTTRHLDMKKCTRAKRLKTTVFHCSDRRRRRRVYNKLPKSVT